MKLLLVAEHVELLVELVVDVGLPLAEVAENGFQVALGLLVRKVASRPVQPAIRCRVFNDGDG